LLVSRLEAVVGRYVEAGSRGRAPLAELLGTSAITAGQMSYDLRWLRTHRLITRIPRSHRFRVTDPQLQHAMLLTHIHTPLLHRSSAGRVGRQARADRDPVRAVLARRARGLTAMAVWFVLVVVRLALIVSAGCRQESAVAPSRLSLLYLGI
jgi:hypothetical protein